MEKQTDKQLIKKIMEGQCIEGYANKMLLVEKAIKEARKGMIKIEDVEKMEEIKNIDDSEIISRWGKTFRERLIIKHYVSDWKKLFKQSLKKLGEKQ
jgi:hypothetical protein